MLFMLSLNPMKPKIHILLVGALCLSVSVMLATEKSFETKVVNDYHVGDLSKIEFTAAPSLQLVYNHNFDFVGTIEHLDYSFKRECTRVEYVAGKVQNKALPLSRKLWLLNCQIALK